MRIRPHRGPLSSTTHTLARCRTLTTCLSHWPVGPTHQPFMPRLYSCDYPSLIVAINRRSDGPRHRYASSHVFFAKETLGFSESNPPSLFLATKPLGFCK
jgi:hypothetical protein